MRNKKVWVGIVVLALVLAGAGIGYAKSGNSSSSKKKDLVVLSDVTRRTLQDTVTLTGTLAREEKREVTTVTQGRVSAVYAKNGTTGRDGERLFALDGRDAIAEHGTVRFFRSLNVGDRGDDVLQLKKILAAAGDDPGTMDTLFTQQTQFALAQWQAQHHYPGAAPTSPQSVTVSLTQGSGYTLGDETAAGLIIGPAGAQTTALRTGPANAAHHAELTALRTDGSVTPFATPVLRIQSMNAVVSEGTPATFEITASQPAPAPDGLTVNLNAGGTANANDIVAPPASVTLPATATSVVVSVPTRVDQVVKPKKTLILALAGGSGYSVGSPAFGADPIINSNVPSLHIAGGGTVRPGESRDAHGHRRPGPGPRHADQPRDLG